MRCAAKSSLVKGGFLMSMKALFLNFCTLDISGRIVLCCGGGCPVHCRVFGKIPCLYPLDTNGTPPCAIATIKKKKLKNLQPLLGVSLGEKLSLLPSTGLGDMIGTLAVSASPFRKKAPQRSHEWACLIRECLLRRELLERPAKRSGPTSFISHLHPLPDVQNKLPTLMSKMEIIVPSSHRYPEDADWLFAKHLVEQKASDIGAQ